MSDQEQKTAEGTKKRKGFFARMRRFVIIVLIISLLSGSVITTTEKKADAFFCFCVGILCWPDDILISIIFWFIWKLIWDPIIKKNIRDHILHGESNWIVKDFYRKFFVRGLNEMTTYLSAVGMYQTTILGGFFDAKQQLETQRLFWRLQSEAHRDYHPSEDFCWFGTTARSLSSTEDRANYGRAVISKRAISRQLGNINSNASQGDVSDLEGRWRHFVKTYCDPRENNWSQAGTGMELACDHDGTPGGATGAVDPKRVNRDLDFTRLIDFPRTLDVNFDQPAGTPASVDEEDVLAMASNLYGHKVLSNSLSASQLKADPASQDLYLALRSAAAKRSVAYNSFNAIVALKSAGTGNSTTGAQFMASLVKDLMPAATTNQDVYDLIGENPSYYSQLEYLAKRIYESPDFYANLYDSPANVARKSVAMKAIESMVDRALFESELRQEMLLSVLLTNDMRQRFRGTNKSMLKKVE